MMSTMNNKKQYMLFILGVNYPTYQDLGDEMPEIIAYSGMFDTTEEAKEHAAKFDYYEFAIFDTETDTIENYEQGASSPYKTAIGEELVKK